MYVDDIMVFKPTQGSGSDSNIQQAVNKVDEWSSVMVYLCVVRKLQSLAS